MEFVQVISLCCSKLAEPGNEMIFCDDCDVCVHQVQNFDAKKIRRLRFHRLATVLSVSLMVNGSVIGAL